MLKSYNIFIHFFLYKKKTNLVMGNLLYTIAVILIIIWAIGFLGGFVASGLIHILLVIAVVAVVLRLIRGDGQPLL